MKHVVHCFSILLAVTLSTSAVFAQNTLTSELPTPVQLKPASNAPITLHVVDDSRVIYQTIGKEVGIDVLFDPDYISKKVAVDITQANLASALQIVGDVSNSFYKTINPDSIFVAVNNHGKHTDLDDLFDHIFYLHNASQASDANEIHTAIRNMLPPDAKTYLVSGQNIILVRGTAEQIALVQKLIDGLDKPKRTYRLTYTVKEIDGGKLVGTEHFALVSGNEQDVTLKQGSKVPILTGSYSAVSTDSKAAGAQTQFTYLDVGMNIDATLTDMGDQAMIKSYIEQSSVAPELSRAVSQDPTILHAALKGIFAVTLGKPLALGSIDIPHSTRHLDIEIEVERVQ